MGLTTLTMPEDPNEWDLRVDDDRNAWVLTGVGAGAPARLYLDRATGFPVRVESLGTDGAVLLFSDLRRYQSSDVEGISKAALPRMPTMIDIADPDGTMAVKLALGEPTSKAPGGRWTTVFDLDGLTRYLRPTQTHRLGVSAGSR